MVIEREALPSIAEWWRPCAVLAMCIVVEFAFSFFAATYLHEELGLSEAKAAAGGAAWGIGMAIGRFAVSIWPPPRSLIPSVAGIGLGFVLLWGVSNPVVAIVGIGIAGLGAAPLYPIWLTVLIGRFPTSPHVGAARWLTRVRRRAPDGAGSDGQPASGQRRPHRIPRGPGTARIAAGAGAYPTPADDSDRLTASRPQPDG